MSACQSQGNASGAYAPTPAPREFGIPECAEAVVIRDLNASTCGCGSSFGV